MNTPARQLFDITQELATLETNPVLEILPDEGVVKLNERYPKPILVFGGDELRAYYHCHTAPDRPDNEHGHFHIFIKVTEDTWSHLVGLSMDNHGQPLQWFCVNHWVSGEQWYDADILVTVMHSYDTPANLGMTERWLLAMLEFYRPEIEKLLQERDDILYSYCKEWQLDAILQERSIYILSGNSINLLDDLSYPGCHGLSIKV
jgi:hypothetical protein